MTIFKTPGGSPTDLAMAPNSSALRGVNSLGFKMAVHPAAKQGAIFQVLEEKKRSEFLGDEKKMILRPSKKGN